MSESDQHSAAATEDASLESSSAADVENDPEDFTTPAALPLSMFCPFFILIAGAVLSLLATMALILNGREGYEIDYCHVSSFNVFKNSSSITTWDANLSVNRSELADRSVAYEARSWLYSRNGFISVSSPSMRGGGGQLILHSNFTMKEIEEEAVARDGILIIDLLIEANATRGSGTLPQALYLMIECSGLEIEFTVNRSYGELSGDVDGGVKRCGLQAFATKADALESSRIVDMLRRLFYYLAFRTDRGMPRVY